MKRNGLSEKALIAYDFTISPYEVSVVYYNQVLKYIFSSKLNEGKFKERIQANREKIDQSLTKRFGIQVSVDMLADIKLYSSIEKRGFLIYRNGEPVDCLETLKLDGLKLTTKI